MHLQMGTILTRIDMEYSAMEELNLVSTRSGPGSPNLCSLCFHSFDGYFHPVCSRESSYFLHRIG